jgi:hypothetical protein
MLQRQTKGRAIQVCFPTTCRSIHQTNLIAVLSDRQCGGTTMTNERERKAGKFCCMSRGAQLTCFIIVLSDGECDGTAATNILEKTAGKFCYIYIYILVHN